MAGVNLNEVYLCAAVVLLVGGTIARPVREDLRKYLSVRRELEDIARGDTILENPSHASQRLRHLKDQISGNPFGSQLARYIEQTIADVGEYRSIFSIR